jgi:hypothetical protein
MRKILIILFCALFLCGSLRIAEAALVKTETTQALEWTPIAAQGVLETGTINVSGGYDTTLHIDCALTSTTAHTGTEIIVQIASEASVNDAWTDLARFIGPVGTAIKVDLGGDAIATATTLIVTNPTTNNLDLLGKFVYLKETSTIASSEIVYQTGCSLDAGDTITILNGLTHAQTAANSDFYTIDTATDEAVKSYAVTIPASASQARVIFNNNYDTTASTVDVRVRVTAMTGI